MAEYKRDVLVPAFDGGLINAKYLIGGFFVLKTRTQRNSLKKLYRFLDGVNTTMCFVSGDNTIYELINNPDSDTTQDSDWRIAVSIQSGLRPIGAWDANNADPTIFDSDAVEVGAGFFYIVTGALSPTLVTIPGLFGGAATTVKNGDLVVSNGTIWFVSSPSATWDSISKPQVIVDYVDGIVISHEHEITDISGLQFALDEKYDSGDVAPLDVDFDTIPDNSIIALGFLKQYYYRKSETYSKDEVDGLIPDLSNFYTSTEVDNLFTDFLDSINSILNINYYTQSEVDDLITDALSAVPGLIIGEATLAERNALVGGVDSVNGYLLRNKHRLVVTDPDLSVWVDEFNGGNGNSGLIYWTRLYPYSSSGGGASLELITATASPNIILDFASNIDVFFKTSVTINSSRSLSFSNDSLALRFKFSFLANDGVVLTLPLNVKMDTPQWDSTAKQLTIFGTGIYAIEGSYINGYWLIDLKGGNYN